MIPVVRVDLVPVERYNMRTKHKKVNKNDRVFCVYGIILYTQDPTIKIGYGYFDINDLKIKINFYDVDINRIADLETWIVKYNKAFILPWFSPYGEPSFIEDKSIKLGYEAMIHDLFKDSHIKGEIYHFDNDVREKVKFLKHLSQLINKSKSNPSKGPKHKNNFYMFDRVLKKIKDSNWNLEWVPLTYKGKNIEGFLIEKDTLLIKSKSGNLKSYSADGRIEIDNPFNNKQKKITFTKIKLEEEYGTNISARV